MDKPKTVIQYISTFPKETQKQLREMRAHLKKIVPNAEESLKWSIPAFTEKRVLFTYAAFKEHIGFYPTPAAIKKFSNELKNYKTAKGSIQFPITEPLPLTLIKKIAKFRVKQVKENDAKWM